MMEKKFRALLIDDRETDNFLNNLMIKEDKIPVLPHFVSSGNAALEFLANCTEDDFPELIFVDLNMPEMDGFEFVEAYNLRYGQRGSNTRLYFLTSSIRTAERERAQGLPNVHGFFNKPLRRKLFDSIIGEANAW